MSGTISERVQRGADLLDERAPLWFVHVPIDTWGRMCGYLDTLAAENHADSVACGFLATRPWEIEPLKAEWVRVITERRAAA